MGVTLAMQIATSILSSAVLVSAPLLTAAAGVAVEKIGYFSSLSTLSSMVFLMVGGPFLVRIGPLRLLQGGLLLTAIATLLVTAAVWPLVLVAALLCGMGYGPIPPATSDILARHTPPHRRGLAFSLKQAGVPIGQATGALIVPILAVLYDWRLGIGVAVLIAIAAVVTVQPMRERFDAARNRQMVLPFAGMLSRKTLIQPFRGVRLSPALPWLAFIGFGFALAQSSFFSFFVPYLTVELGFGVAGAGFAFAVLQLSGAVGRIAAGWWADRTSNMAMLLVLAVGSASALVLMTLLPAGLPTWAIAGAAIFSGFAAVSWNGIYLAELAARVARDEVGEATSGATFFSFIGYVMGPAGFSLVVQATGSYAVTFLLMVAAPLSAALTILKVRRAYPA